MPDIEIICIICSKSFIWTSGEQDFYRELGFIRPRKCQACRKRKISAGNAAEPCDLVDQRRINEFVRSVEDHKGFKRDVRLVFAHLTEEVGELARAIYLHEQKAMVSDAPDTDGICQELLDIIFLACYLADILAVDLNAGIPKRMASIREQYGMEQ